MSESIKITEPVNSRIVGGLRATAATLTETSMEGGELQSVAVDRTRFATVNLSDTMS